MKRSTITSLRLSNQQISDPRHKKVEKLVAELGAIQAQDYSGALWAVGLRAVGVTKAAVEQALAERRIIRTWPMRGTLHFVTPVDVRWMLALQQERIIAKAAARHRQLELDEKIFRRSADLLATTLQGGRQMTRDELYGVLERAKISTEGQRGYHILWRSGLDALICFGPRQGRQQTFVLLDEWVPKTGVLDREAALAELARRYFTSHGPATVQDFIWWSGLNAADARAGLAMSAARLEQVNIEGTGYWMSGDQHTVDDVVHTERFHLLPGYDEYLLGYKDRAAALVPQDRVSIVPARNGVMRPVIVMDGVVVGTWKRTIRKKDLLVTASPFSRLSKSGVVELHKAVARYGSFLGTPVEARTG